MKKRILSFFLVVCFILMNAPMTVSAFNIKDKDKQRVEKAINALKGYYINSENKMEYLEAMAYLHCGTDINKDREDVIKKIDNIQYNNNAMNCLKGIMTSMILDKNPKDFHLSNEKSLNYVEGMLKNYNKVKHNFYSQDNVNSQCIIALDMLKEDYDKELTIKALIDNFARNKNVCKASLILIALSNHRDLPGVNDGIQKYKEYLKSQQESDGGFCSNASGNWNAAPIAISSVIQALVALGEDPLSNEWTKNGKTMLDALMEYEIEDGTFSIDRKSTSSWAPKRVRHNTATSTTFAALADLYKGESMYKCCFKGADIKPEPKPEPKPDSKPEEDRKVSFIDIFIDGKNIESNLQIKVKESKNILIEVKDQNGNKIEDKKIELNSDKQLVEFKNNNLIALKEGIDKVSIQCDKIKKIITINIIKDEDKPKPEQEPQPKPKPEEKEEILDRKLVISNTIKEIKNHYKEKEDSYTFLETLGLIYSGTNKELIKDKVNIYKYDFVKCISENIIVIKAIGEDPTNYKGKNYANLLLNPKEHSFNDNYINVLAKKMIALDMANVNYDKEKTIKELISKYTNDDIENFSSIIIAISSHKDIDGVKEFIEKYKSYIKKIQLDNGSFKNNYGKEDSGIVSLVIQALVAIGENPLSTKWGGIDKSGKKTTLIDILLKYKDGSEFKPDNGKYSSVSDIYTGRALAALSDVLNGKSMYTNIGNQQVIVKNMKIISENDLGEINLNGQLQLKAVIFDYLDNQVLNKSVSWSSSDNNIATIDEKGLVKTKSEGNVKITATIIEDKSIKATFDIKVINIRKSVSTRILKSENIKNGQDARITIKAINDMLNERNANVIVALYDKSNNKMINYVADKKILQTKREEIINTGFTIPKTGEFIVKVLVWDNMKDNNPYSNPILLNVTK